MIVGVSCVGSQAVSRPLMRQCGVISSITHQIPALHSQEETKAQWCVFELIGLAWISSLPFARIVVRVKRNNGYTSKV